MTARIKGRALGACAMGLAALSLAGCSAKWNTAFRDRPIRPDGPSVITVDAKQRHVLIQPEFENTSEDANVVKLRMCAEPAPDVFAAIATSGSGSLGVDAKTQSGEGAFGLSASETAATIERTQTINLLRESFFRTCERYLNGAISKEAFIVQAGRDARAMVAVMAIEQLTGTIRPPATIISGPAVTANAQLSSELVTLYGAAYKRRDEAEVAYKPLKGKEDADCSKLAGDPKTACETEKTKAAAAKAELDSANARVAEIVKISGNVGQGTGVLASTTAGTNQGGGGTNPTSKSDIAAVANTVEAIVKEVTQVDDMKLYCIERLHTFDRNEALYSSCLTLLVAATNSEATALDGTALLEAAQLQIELAKLEALSKARMGRFAAAAGRLSQNCTTTFQALNLSPRQRREICGSDQNASMTAFGRLDPDQQDEILDLLEKGK